MRRALSIALCLLAFALAPAACTSGDFTGSADKSKKDKESGATGGATGGTAAGKGTATGGDAGDGPDGGDGNDGTESGEPDSGDSGVPDSGEPDSGDDVTDTDSGSDTDGGSQTKLTSPLRITTTTAEGDEDECGSGNVQIKVEAYVSGKVTKTKTVKCPEESGQSVELEGFCTKAKATCLKVTLISDKTQDSWANRLGCVFIGGSGNKKTLDFDANGAGVFGTCKAGEDDQITLECETKELKVKAC